MKEIKENLKQLWPHCIGNPFYWYSVLDGIVLLRAIRQNVLEGNSDKTQEHPKPDNDILSARQDNRARIFVADPYTPTNFSETFEQDITFIFSQWSQKPTLLVLPLISGLSWRGVIVRIDYDNVKFQIYWYDPSGKHHFPEALKKHIRISIKKILARFIDIKDEDKCLLEICLEDNVPVTSRRSNDCGPILFNMISDSIQLTKMYKTIGQIHEIQLSVARREHQIIYRQMAGLQGKDLPKFCIDKAILIVNSYPKITSKNDQDKLLEHPFWLGLCCTYLENHRIRQREPLEPPYSKKEINRAYKNVVEEKSRESRHLSQESEKYRSELVDGELRSPFMWHIKHHFRGVIEKTERIDRGMLLAYLIVLEREIRRLSEAGQFDKVEKFVRDVFIQRLKDHTLRKMALQITSCTDHDEDEKTFKLLEITDSDYQSSLRSFYKYSNQGHFRHVVRTHFLAQENPSTVALTSALDISLNFDTKDPLWNYHVRYMPLDFLYTSLFQDGQILWLIELSQGTIPKHSLIFGRFLDGEKTETVEALKQHKLDRVAKELLDEEKLFTLQYLTTASTEIQLYESKCPGFFVTLLCALHAKSSDYNVQVLGVQRTIEIRKDCINKFGLKDAWDSIGNTSILKRRLHLAATLKPSIDECKQQFDNYENQVLDRRLQFYAQQLAHRELQSVNQHDLLQDVGSRTFYINSTFLSGIGNGWERGQYTFEEGKGLSDPRNLIELCGGNDNLAWLVHQYAEYELDVWDDVIDAVDFEHLGLDIDIAVYILRKTFLDHNFYPYEILENGFIPAVFSRFLHELTVKKEDVDPNAFEMPSLTQFASYIKNDFVKLLADGKIQELQIRFDDAYHRRDWLEVQKLWPVFTKFQRLLISTEKMRETSKKHPQYKPPMKGDDFDFGKEKLNDYSTLLNRAWNAYQDRSNRHYDRIYFSHDINILKYGSRMPKKIATLDITEIFRELKNISLAIENQVAAFGDNANIFTPVLCFVLTNMHHVKNGDHGRIVVPISLDLLVDQKKYLLSKDFEDGVFEIEDDEMKNSYLKQKANLDYRAGRIAMLKEDNEDISNAHNSAIYHSERVMLELLRKPEMAQKLVQLLKHKLEQILGYTLDNKVFKIYGLAMLAYSTNSICNLCTPSLISLQNSHQQGFLKNLSDALNQEASNFKTSGYNNETKQQVPEKFPMLTVISANKPWSEQAHELQEKSVSTPKDSKTMENPKGVIHLPDDAINIQQCGLNEKGIAYSYHRSLIEFVGNDFSKKPLSTHPYRFQFTGNIFMSGSKNEKFEGNVDGFNQEVSKFFSNEVAMK